MIVISNIEGRNKASVLFNKVTSTIPQGKLHCRSVLAYNKFFFKKEQHPPTTTSSQVTKRTQPTNADIQIDSYFKLSRS